MAPIAPAPDPAAERRPLRFSRTVWRHLAPPCRTTWRCPLAALRGRRTPARRRCYFFRSPARRYFNVDPRISASSSGSGGARYGGGRPRAVGAHPPPSAARRAAGAIRGSEGLRGWTGGAAAARVWAGAGAEVPGREAGPAEASAVGLPSRACVSRGCEWTYVNYKIRSC